MQHTASSINKTEKQIKVLMLVPNLRVSNGVTSYAMNYFRGLDHTSIRVDFAAYKKWENPYEDGIIEAGGKVYVLPPIKKIVSHVKACKEIIKSGQYDIIHDNSLLITYPLMRIAKNYVKVRILHSHSARLGETARNEKRNRLFLPLLLRTSNYYAACSEKAGRALFGEKQFTVIPNVIHTEHYRFDREIRERIRSQFGVKDKKVIGAVGRLTDAKNPFFAIDIMEKVFAIEDKIIFWWIGNGVLDEEVARYVKDNKLDDKVFLLGARNDVPDLLQAMDVFFLPSKSEGFGLACLEASATGLPCIVSNNFPSDVNVAGNIQFLSLNCSMDLWAKKIIDALHLHPDRIQASVAIAGSECSDEDAGERLYRYYRSILNAEK